MGLSRREFVAMLAGASGGVVLPLWFSRARASRPGGVVGSDGPSTPGRYFRWSPLSDRVWLAEGGGGNSLLYLGPRGSLMVDAKSFGLGRSLVREARDLGAPVTHLVVTHHHEDHSGGVEAFRDAERLAHENAAPRILDVATANLDRGRVALSSLESRLADPAVPREVIDDVRGMAGELADLSPEDFAATRTFSSEAVIDLGGASALARWVSRGHTDGDAWVLLAEENLIHCGDLVFHGRHPYVDVGAGATPRGWALCIEDILGYCDEDTVIVPGHGGATDRTGLEAQRDYFRRLEAVVERGRVEGRTREEIQAMGSDAFEDLDGGDELLARNLGLVYDEAEGLSPLLPSPIRAPGVS